ncbi:MAG: Ig-like domain repeat protein [Methanobrevibacter sp.]|nr:Ig-like domain repeat protein [Methanobrevibacter sp.]
MVRQIISLPEVYVNFNITNCTFKSNNESAIYVKAIDDCNIVDSDFLYGTNRESHDGAAVELMGSCNVNFDNDDFVYNDVEYGTIVGKIDIEGIFGSGAAVYINTDSGSNFTFNGCLFENNTVALGGGAIFSDSELDNLIITNCDFINNTAFNSPPPVESFFNPDGGAAIYINSNVENFEISDSRFKFNTANQGSAIVYNGDTPLSISDSEFIDNKLTVIDVNLICYSTDEAQVVLSGGNTQIDAVYSANDVVSFSNVSYSTDKGILNTDDVYPIYSSHIPFQNVTIEFYDETSQSTKTITNMTNENGVALFRDLNLEYGTQVRAYHSENTQYVYGEDETTVEELGEFTILQNLIMVTSENGVLELKRNFTFTPGLDDNLIGGIVIDKNITILGNGFTINALNQSRIFLIYDGVDYPHYQVTLENITFINANGYVDNNLMRYGGAILTINDLIVENCVFSNNSAEVCGAICSMQANILTINDSNFTNCTAFSAGAVGVMQCNNFTINNSFFTENFAMYGGAVLMEMINNTMINNTYFIRNNATVIGSAIASWQSNLTISESGFLNNSVVLDDNYGDENPCGGTVAIAYSSSSELNIITDCDFLNNTVYGTNQPLIGGSAVLMYGDFNSPPEATLFVNNSNFDNNGVFLNGSNMVVMGSFFMYSIKDLTVNNSNFTNNNISVNGSSMFVGGSSISILGVNAFNVNNSNFSNNTAFSNESEYSGGAIFAYYVEGDMNISNSNFDNNNAFSNESELNGGGAIFALEIIGDITIGHSNFDNNNAFSNESELNGGGAIFAYYVGGDMNISDSGFDNNNAFSNESEYNGGAIFALEIMGDMNVSNSNFTNNSACNGSAIYILQSNNVNLINSSFLENLANASIVLDINETDYSAVATVIANDNYINAVYCDEATLNFDNVTYWDGEKIVNSNDVSPVLSTVLPNRIVVFDVYDEEKKLYKTFSLLTNDSSQVEFEYLDWIDGDFNVSSHITADAYYRSSSFKNEISIRIGDFNRLQLYVDKTPDGGVLNLTRDYKYTIGLDTIDEGIEIKKNITINGNGYTIDAQNKSRIFFIANDEHQSTSGVLLANVTINNITFINGNRYEENHQERGGAIYASVGNSLIIDNCTFKDNLAVQGGAVFLVLCMGTIQNSLFTDNCATDAAGALLTMFSYADIENCTFINNSAGQAGAVECVIGGLTIVESDFINNTASLVCGAFGAMMFGTIEIQSSNFINNTIKNNSSDNIGCGAVEFGMGDNVIINDCNFTNNIVNASGNSNAGIIYGGAIITTVVLNTMINQSTFDNNGIIYEGNALAIGGAISDFYQDIGTGDYNITISNSNFTNNYAGIGGAIYLDHKNNITIYNVHLTNNTADEGAGIFINRSSNVTVEDSSFVNNTAGNGAAVYVSGSTNVTVNGSSFADNSANAYAGGIFAKDSTLNITNSNFTGNEGVNGSALYVSGSKVGVNNTEFGENSNDNSIYLGSGNLNIENSHLYDSNSIYNGGETSLTNVIELSSGGDYVILNKGNLLLNNNKFNNLIINDINVATKTNVVILENRTIATTERSYMLIANVTDDAGNTIKLNEFKFKDGDTVLGDATFDGKLYSFYYEDISIGAHLISALFDGLEDADMKIGIIKVLNPSFLELDISQISNNDVVINATISPGDISGNISFMVNNIVYEREIKDGVASLTLKNLIPGTYNVLATYPGNEFYMNSSDNSSFVVKFLPSTIMLDVDVENAVIKASVTEGATGNVTFIVDDVAYTKQVGEDLDYEMFAPGNHSIVAIYNGDAFYSSSYNLTVVEGNKYESFIYVSANNIVYGNDTIICVEIGEGQTGSVTISVGGKNYTKVIDDIIIKFSVSGLDAGNYTVYASYSGDEYYNETADSGSFNVTKADLDADVSALDVTTLENASFILSVPDDFAGKVKITVDDETYDGDVNTLVQMASLTEGSKSATVEFYGDNNYKDLTLTAKFNVTEELKPVVKNESGVEVEVIDNKVVAGVASGVEGNVTFIVNGKEYSREIVDGKAVLDDASFVVGNNSIVAYYPGNDDFNSSIDSIEYELAKLASLVKVSAKDISYGGDAVIDVEVPVAQTGTVTITVGGKSYTEEIKNGKSSFSIPDLSVDTYQISVTYDGDANYDVITNSSSFKVIPARLDACVSALDVTTLENASFILSVPDDFAGKVKISVDGKTYDGDVNTLIQMASLTEGSKSATVEFYGDNNYKNLTLTAEFKVTEETTPVVKKDANVTIDFNNDKITVTLPDDATGNVTIFVNDEKYVVPVKDGKAVLSDVQLTDGENVITAIYSGDEDYNLAYGDKNVLIKNNKTITISAENVTKYFSGPEKFEVSITYGDGTPVPGIEVLIKINGVEYDRATNTKGIASFSLNLNSGNYTVDVKVDEFNFVSTNHVEILPTIYAADVTKVYRNGTQYYALFLDGEGNPLVNTEVSFNINGIFYKRTTNASGWAKLNLNLEKGTYILTAINPSTSEMRSNIMTVISQLETCDLTKYYKNDSQFVVRVRADDGSWAGAGEVVSFNVHGRLYNRTTNATGHAVLNINLEPEEYTITSYYKECREGNTIKVLPVLTASDLNMKYKDGSQFKAKLVDGQGKPYAGQNITFNINGVFYNRTTDSGGVAKLNINLQSGKYIITSEYDGSRISNTIKIGA